MNSAPSQTYTIDFYGNPAADPSGYGEGKTYLGSMTVTTSAAGDVQFSQTLSATFAATDVVSATATDASGNTSEFSPAWAVTPVQIANENGLVARSNALDAIWSSVTGQSLGPSVLTDGNTSLNSLSISGNWKAVYDSSYVYFLVTVNKPGGPVADGPAGQPYEDDAIEFFIDPTYARGTTYGANDVQIIVRPNDSTLYTYQNSGPGPALPNSGVWTTSSNGTGYTVKLAVKWTDLGLAGPPAAGSPLGVDVQADEDPGTNGSPSGRIGKLTWSSTEDDASKNPSAFGMVLLGQQVNQPPTLSATALNPTFTEAAGLGTQAAAVNVFNTAADSTIEAGQTILGLNFTVGGLLDGASERIVVDGTAITLGANSSGTTATNTMAYNVTIAAGTATVTLTKAAGVSTANIATLINGITYQNTNTDNPSAGNRVFTLTQIRDSGGTANGGQDTTALAVASSVNVVRVNDAPVLATGSVLAYTENQAATAINTVITTADLDNATLASGTVSITTNFAAGQDVLGFTNVPATMGNIAGAYNAATGVMTLTSAGATATTAQWQAALRAVNYSNSSDSPSVLARTVSYTVNDGTVNSNTVTSTINVTAVNDAPVLATVVCSPTPRTRRPLRSTR